MDESNPDPDGWRREPGAGTMDESTGDYPVDTSQRGHYQWGMSEKRRLSRWVTVGAGSGTM